MFNLQEREWKVHFIGELFDVKRPKARLEKQYVKGDIPFVASGSVNNGVMTCCQPCLNEELDKGNCITVSPVDGSVFYQEIDFLGRGGAGSSILMLYNEYINRYSGLFFARVIAQTCSKYTYGKMGNKDGIKRERILLPVDKKGKPDYVFMEEYIKEREKVLLQKYRKYIENKRFLNCDVQPLSTLEWKEFFIKDIFTISSGKRLTKSDMDNGLIPFVGAIDSNNGITNWIGTPNCSFDKNVLGVNYNGSVVENFYHTYGCVFSDDVKRLHLKNYSDNQYVLLFLKTIILQQKSKYTYGYKFNGHRMERQKILLPINEQGEPDYVFMENYVKNQEKLLLQKYLKYIEKRIEE